MKFIIQPLEIGYEVFQDGFPGLVCDIDCIHNHVSICGCTHNDVGGCACPQK